MSSASETKAFQSLARGSNGETEDKTFGGLECGSSGTEKAEKGTEKTEKKAKKDKIFGGLGRGFLLAEKTEKSQKRSSESRADRFPDDDVLFAKFDSDMDIRIDGGQIYVRPSAYPGSD